MQELTFDQVEHLSGGFQDLTAPGDYFQNDQYFSAQDSSGSNCRSFEGQPLSPGVVGGGASAIAVVSRLNPWVGAALAGGFAWLSASAAQGGTTCGTPMTKEQVNEAIDRGLASGGPL